MIAERFQPILKIHHPQGFFEIFLSYGRDLPGPLGYICYRKLKRRYSRRKDDNFSKLVDDLRPSDLCIDLGANVGDITRLMAAKGADVIGFEPDPDTFELLQRNTADIPGVTLHQQAVGVEAARLKLRRSKRIGEDTLRFSQASSVVVNSAKMDDDNFAEVDVIDFLAFLRDLDRDIRILKVDIEGSEWELIPALMNDPIVDRIDAIFVELHEWIDPKRFVPVARDMQAKAEALRRPYINLLWH